MENASHDALHQHRHEGDEYRRIEVITGTVRRRRWSAEEKAALVAESLQPGINVSVFARRHGVSRGLLQTWRRAAMRQATADSQLFVPLRIEEAAATEPASQATSRRAAPPETAGSAPISEAGTLEIESAGLRVRLSGPVDTEALRLVLAHVARHT